MSKENKRIMTKQEFVQKTEDYYAIYQLKEEAENLLFMDFKALRAEEGRVEYGNYEMVYSAPWDASLNLDKIYMAFNEDHPEDYKAHSLSVSDVVVIKRGDMIECHYVDGIGYKDVTLEFWQPQQYAVAVMNRFISIHSTEEGYDYSVYDKDLHLLDGGIYDDPDMKIDEAWKEIYKDFVADEYLSGLASHFSVIRQVSFEKLRELVTKKEKLECGELLSYSDIQWYKDKTELFFHKISGKSAGEIEDEVWKYLNFKKSDKMLDIELTGLAIFGSRSRGMEKGYKSDIDVVVEYSGDYAEDMLFNVLNEDNFKINGILVDVNPICCDKSGTLKDYLLQQEKFYWECLIEEEVKEKLPYYNREFPLSVIEECLKEKGYRIDRRSVEKTSGRYEGLSIVNGSCVAPLIYLETVLNFRPRKEWTLEDVVDGFVDSNRAFMLQLLRSGFRPASDECTMKRGLEEFEGIEEYIYVQVPNSSEMNLEDRIDLDALAICGISEEEAWERARKNTFAEAKIMSMSMVMGDVPMYVITNKQHYRGASCILHERLRMELKKRTGICKFYAIPASQHEMIVFPYSEDVEEEYINQTIVEVNESAVAPEEYLGDKVYVWEI